MNKESLLNHLGPGWELTCNNTRLLRSFTFKNYKEAWNLVNKISEHAEAVNHHPEIRFGWGHLEVEIWTHTVNDLSEQDFEFAKKIDQLSMTT